jgi:hypothetical protein
MSVNERKLFEEAMQAQADVAHKAHYFNVNADGAYINLAIEAGFQGWIVARTYHVLTKLTHEVEVADKVCVEADGCPTETAVLKRFWREHQAKHIPFSIDRTHKNQAYVTLGFDSVDDCTSFIKSIS